MSASLPAFTVAFKRILVHRSRTFVAQRPAERSLSRQIIWILNVAKRRARECFLAEYLRH